MKLEHIKTKAGWTEDSVDLDSTRVIEEHELLGPEDKIDSRDVAPDRKIWEHPLVRLGAAFGVVGFAVMLFFAIVAGDFGDSEHKLSDRDNNTVSDNADESGESNALKKLAEENARLKAENALGTQKGKLEEALKPTPTPAPPTTASPTARQSAPTSSRDYSYRSPRVASAPRAYSPPARSYAPAPTPARYAAVPQPQLDPLTQWAMATKLGTWQGSGRRLPTSSPPVAMNPQASQDQNGVSNANNVPFSPYAVPSTATQNRPSSVTAYNPRSQMVNPGSRVEGRLETAIAWLDDYKPQRKYQIRLTEGLKGTGGTVLPANSILSATLTQAYGTVPELEVTGVFIDRGGQTIEQPIPKGAISVTGSKGKLLQASIKRKGMFGRDVLASLLSGVSGAAQLYNRAEREVRFNDGYGSSTSTNYRKPNYTAGFVEGITNTMVRRMQARNEAAANSDRTPIYLINPGARVELYVNEPFSL